MIEADPAAALPRAAARLRRMLSFLLGFAILLLLLERLAYAGAFLPDRGAAAFVPALGRQLVFAAPAILYLLALWHLRQALAWAARGAPFGPLVPVALERVGWLLVAGAAVAIFLMPAAHRLLGVGFARLIDHDLASIILAAIGAGLTFLARLIRRAAEIEGELDEMF